MSDSDDEDDDDGQDEDTDDEDDEDDEDDDDDQDEDTYRVDECDEEDDHDVNDEEENNGDSDMDENNEDNVVGRDKAAEDEIREGIQAIAVIYTRRVAKQESDLLLAIIDLIKQVMLTASRVVFATISQCTARDNTMTFRISPVSWLTDILTLSKGII